MSYFEAIILGLVQGLAEFLPISSSGHLALLQQAFGIHEDKVLLFAVLLHVGYLDFGLHRILEGHLGTDRGALSDD